ncbi:unnamed protein product [Echinostoma caproni]|uniref:6-pyruvoyltetrahydropterin synthase n=1 Tax=Echinostoma caproni TaxID=27848 RepID=A0A183B9A5_9TREM|nr:unnamed protein product [Echinostoma caproni]
MAARCYLTRVEQFSACHRLHSIELDDSTNQNVFGMCNNANGHGHNYKMEVTLYGAVDHKTGMVMNISDLKKIIQQEVVALLDHKNIDMDVAYFRDNKIVSTAENICIFIWRQLSTKINHNLLYEVKLWETDKNIVVYRGD